MSASPFSLGVRILGSLAGLLVLVLAVGFAHLHFLKPGVNG